MVFYSSYGISILQKNCKTIKPRKSTLPHSFKPATIRQHHFLMDFSINQRVVLVPSLWPDYSEIRVGFMNGKPKKREFVKAVIMKHIAPIVNLNIIFVDSYKQATIRIQFNNDGESNSHVGIDTRSVPKNKATMDLGIREADDKKDKRGTVLHEFMHALGFEHEHQSPKCPLKINIKQVMKNQGWSKKEAKRNLKKLTGKKYDYSNYDPLSIMHYFFLEEEILNDVELLPPNTKLSVGDKLALRKLYPKAWVANCNPDYRLPFHHDGTFYWLFYMEAEKRLEIYEEKKKGGGELKWRAGRKCDNRWDTAKIIYKKDDKAFESPILYRTRTKDGRKWYSKRRIYDLTFDKIKTGWV